MEFHVTNSPFSQEQADLLNRLLPTLSEQQRIWLNGYLSALQGAAASGAAILTQAPAPAAGAIPAAAAPAAAAVSKDVTVLYGSQTGNSHSLAKKLTKKLEAQGCNVTLQGMSDFKTNNLKKVETLFVVVSTQGEGDPPDNAITFYEFLHSKRAPKLDGLRFSVLALGDLSYEQFCKTGKDFDKRLEELGGTRLAPRVDCDVDFQESAEEWMNALLSALGNAAGAAVTAGAAVSAVPAAAVGAGEDEYSRSNPFPAEVLENLNLNGRGSARETRHLELSLEGSNLIYEPGDSLGIFPENHPQLVDDILAETGWKADAAVAVNKSGETKPLREALLRHYELTVLSKPLVESVAALAAGSGLGELLAPERAEELREYIRDRDLLDLIRDYKLQSIPADALVPVLRKMPPRLYSIASSPSAFPEEVHLTVRAVRYETLGRSRYGVCSVQLAERIQPGDSLPVFIQYNPNFKLPANSDTPIIMIGPGTGVAPFRAFLGEREETAAGGKNWLFFGDQHFATDFLYQIEWQRWLKDGVLTRMDVAFSRDTDRKVYVQHKMLEQAAELYEWIQEGACIYVCGDEKSMAHDVHKALETILIQEGGLSPEDATAYMARLQQEKRYQRDVY